MKKNRYLRTHTSVRIQVTYLIQHIKLYYTPYCPALTPGGSTWSPWSATAISTSVGTAPTRQKSTGITREISENVWRSNYGIEVSYGLYLLIKHTFYVSTLRFWIKKKRPKWPAHGVTLHRLRLGTQGVKWHLFFDYILGHPYNSKHHNRRAWKKWVWRMGVSFSKVVELSPNWCAGH